MYIITWTVIFVQGIVSDQSSNPNLFITNSASVMLMGSALGIIKMVHSLIFLNEVLGTLNSFTCFHSVQSMYNYSVHILWWRTRSDVDGKSMCFWSHITQLGMLHWPFVFVMQSFATCPRCCNKGILLQDAVVERVHSIYRIDARHQHDHSDLTDLIQLLLFLWESFTCWWSQNTLEDSLWKRTDPMLCVKAFFFFLIWILRV